MGGGCETQGNGWGLGWSPFVTQRINWYLSISTIFEFQVTVWNYSECSSQLNSIELIHGCFKQRVRYGQIRFGIMKNHHSETSQVMTS